VGIYGVGRNGGGEGSFLATAGGAAAGLAAGIALVDNASPPLGPAFVLTAGLTTLSGLAAYHWTDRVHIRSAWERGARRPDAKAGRTPAASLRQEVQLTLMRF